jgi:methionyl-tRNA synthetase
VAEGEHESVDDASASTPTVDIDTLARIELRVGEVLVAERVPRSAKLVRLQVDLGEAEPRQVVAGIGAHYQPEELVGRRIVVVANLQPRSLMGLESRGMLLAADSDGRPVLATVAETVPNGSRLK